jgi:hypothetical protein
MSHFDNRDVDALQHDTLRHDDPLRHALGQAPQPPADEVDWMALHARISSAAQPALRELASTRSTAALRRRGATDTDSQRSIWQPLAGWSPFGIPIAAAATVLLMIGAAVIGTEPALSTEALTFRTIEEEFVTGLGGSAAPLIAGIGTDDMLDAVLFYDAEDWQP